MDLKDYILIACNNRKSVHEFYIHRNFYNQLPDSGSLKIAIFESKYVEAICRELGKKIILSYNHNNIEDFLKDKNNTEEYYDIIHLNFGVQ